MDELSNLRTGKKRYYAAALIPAVILLLSLPFVLSEINNQKEKINEERQGIQRINSIFNIMIMTQKIRGLKEIALNKKDFNVSEIITLEKAVIEILNKEEKLSDNYWFSQKEKIKLFHDSFLQIKNNSEKIISLILMNILRLSEI